MQLEHSFSVPVGIDEAWRVLLDIERIGPCMPGAMIDSVDGDDFTGTVKVKLGPINLTYRGKASFVEKDEAAHRAVIDARGRDARGNGTAAATVTATLVESGAATDVRVTTDLDITGKPAQFGRGVMVDVGNKLIGQFADCLAGQLGAGSESPAKAAQPAKAAPKAAKPAKTADSAKAAAKRARPKPSPAPAGPGPDAGSAELAAPGAAELETAAGPDETVAEVVGAEAAPDIDPAAESRSPDDPAGTETEPAAQPPADAGEPADGPSTRSMGAVNGHNGSHVPQPRGEVEPIDLLESAGPAIAKRLAPVAVALVVVLVAVRRRHGRRA